jgi:3-deoxy-manno-octulosonate cytidylyltransferase (CMP-KDO synthetase)
MPLILHVWHRCLLCTGFERVVVATCDEEIRRIAMAAGAEAVMTADTHQRATDRTQEAIANLDLKLADDDLVVMVQGDEALMTPALAEAVIASYKRDKPAVVNLGSRLHRDVDHDDPNTVKVVADGRDRVLYFSRAPIPSRARAAAVPMYQQTGIMGFAAAFLERFSSLPQTPLEIVESVDMLRVLEHGLPISLVRTNTETIGVDTPADRNRAELLMRDDPVTQLYMKVVR